MWFRFLQSSCIHNLLKQQILSYLTLGAVGGLDLGVDPDDLVEALIESKGFRDALRKRILRVVFREEKNGSGRTLKNVFTASDENRCGFLSIDAITNCLHQLQDREFLAKVDVRVLCSQCRTSGKGI